MERRPSIRRAIAALCAGVWLCLLPAGLAAGLPAQDPPLTAAAQQELAQARFRDLTERMQKLMVVLQQSEPQNSKLLMAGLRYAQEKKLQDRLDHASSLLRSQRWDEALVVMADLKSDLATLLDLLQNRNADLKKLLEQMAQYEDWQKRVQSLVQEQHAEKEASARTEQLQQHLADLEQQKQRAQQLRQQQQQLRDETNSQPLALSPAAAAPLAGREGKLQQEAERLAKDLQALEQKAEELKTGAPAGASAAAGRAGSAMGEAQQQLGQQKSEPAVKQQDKALAELDRTLEQLDAMADKARRELEKLPFDEQARRQKDTQQSTDALARDMEKAETPEDGGEGRPSPGKNKVQQAVPKQRAAAGQLEEFVPAKQKQQDAENDLQAAQQELEEALAQLRQQLQDEVLRALEERFTAMLARQKELTAQTRTVHATRGRVLTASGELPAALVQKIGELATGEDELRAEAIDALKLLAEDGTTAVFPPMVEQLRDELALVTTQLRGSETGEPVHERQLAIEDLLGLLVEALRKTIEHKEGGC